MTEIADPKHDIARTALDYLSAMEARDLDAARRHVSTQARFTFPGGRELSSIEDIVGNSRRRYRRISKVIEQVDVLAGDRGVVCVSGTLTGALSDGTVFEGVRFLDRFEIVNGRIVDQRVWNDVGELMLAAHQGPSAGPNGERQR